MPIRYAALGRIDEMEGRQSMACSMNVGNGRVECYVLVAKNQWEKK